VGQVWKLRTDLVEGRKPRVVGDHEGCLRVTQLVAEEVALEEDVHRHVDGA
jgi:hypothetical protein